MGTSQYDTDYVPCATDICRSPRICQEMGCVAMHDETKAEAFKLLAENARIKAEAKENENYNYEQGIRRGLTIARNYLFRTGHHVAAVNLGDYSNDNARVMADSALIDGGKTG